MKFYKAEYRKCGQNTWRVISASLAADGVSPELPNHRFFVESSGVRFEIPIVDMEFKFSKERFENMKEAEAEAATKGKPSK